MTLVDLLGLLGIVADGLGLPVVLQEDAVLVEPMDTAVTHHVDHIPLRVHALGLDAGEDLAATHVDDLHVDAGILGETSGDRITMVMQIDRQDVVGERDFAGIDIIGIDRLPSHGGTTAECSTDGQHQGGQTSGRLQILHVGLLLSCTNGAPTLGGADDEPVALV